MSLKNNTVPEKIKNEINVETFFIDSHNCFETISALKRKILNLFSIDAEN